MNQIELNVSEVTGRAWELSKKHGLVIAVVIFACYMIANIFQSFGFPWQSYFESIAENGTRAFESMAESMGRMYGMQILSGLVQAILMTGILNAVIGLTNGTAKDFSLSAFKMPVTNYVYYFIVHILYSIIVCIGFMLCIIPGIFLAVRLLFAPVHVLTHPEDGISGAFEKSWKMTEGNFWSLFLLGLLAFLICIGGLMCCCIGVYFASAMAYFMMAVAYYTLNPAPVAPVEEA